MSIIASEDQGQAGGIALGLVADTSGFPADSDYVLDKTQTWIWDESIQPLQTVNMILCLMGQTAADKMVNKGAYYALVDEDKCEQGSNQSSAGSSGKSTAAKGKTYNKWVIQSTRQDNTSPMEVKIWVPAKGGAGGGDPMEAMRILVHVTATEGVSANKPFGAFSMNYMGVADAAAFGGSPGTDITVMGGNLRTVDNAQGKPQFEFVDLGGDNYGSNSGLPFSWDNRAAVVMDDASGGSGVARLFNDFGGTAADYVVAYDSGNLLRAKDADGDLAPDMGSYACLSRSTFNTQIWRYDLYHLQAGTYRGQAVSAGERVKMNSGFPFTYGAGLNGFVGYWGLWAEDESVITDGTTITRVDFGSGGNQGTYTVNYSAGRMTKSSADTVPMAQYQGMKFYSSNCFPAPALGCPWDSNYDDWVVSVDANNDLVVTAGLTWGQNGPQETPVGPVVVTPTADGDTVFLWSDALGGQVTYVHDTAVLPSSRTLTYYAMSSLTPAASELSGGTMTVFCYDRCLKGGVTSVTTEADVFYPTDGTAYQYQLAAVNGKLVLTDLNVNPSAVVDFTDPNSGLSAIGYDWGVTSGPMVADNTGIANPWDVYDPGVVSTTYTWESGPNAWNRLVTVTDDATGQVQSFDQPLKFNYTVDAGDDINNDPTLVGTTMLLEYGGSGDLWGFPWTEDPNTGRWYSALNLKDGVQLTDASGNQFVVKAREREQSFKAEAGWVEGQQCGSGADGSGLDVVALFGSLNLPPASNVGQVPFTWADRPTPSNPAPAVIEGEVQ